jgi:hypothetical protein
MRVFFPQGGLLPHCFALGVITPEHLAEESGGVPGRVLCPVQNSNWVLQVLQGLLNVECLSGHSLLDDHTLPKLRHMEYWMHSGKLRR